jgi:hypothetical protein
MLLLAHALSGTTMNAIKHRTNSTMMQKQCLPHSLAPHCVSPACCS